MTLPPERLPYQPSLQTHPSLPTASCCALHIPVGGRGMPYLVCVSLASSLVPSPGRDHVGFFSDPRAQHRSGTEQGASGEEVKDKVTILDLTISLKNSS